MIDFPCNCGYGFSVPDDQAGSAMQCPECKRLNDIPYLSELHNLDDGIYRVDSTPQAGDKVDRVAEMTQVFTRNHFDADGLPIDIRGPIVDAYNTGPIPVESLGPLDKAPPKYDPITGELVEELEIKPEPVTPVNAIPMARRANLGAPTVIHGIDVPEPLEAFSIPLRLFQPANILVMIFILMAHGLGSALTLMMASPLALLVAPIWMIWHGLILAHYGNVIDETGPTSHGELPTPLRHLGWHEDIWGPFMQMVISFAFCFGPALSC